MLSVAKGHSGPQLQQELVLQHSMAEAEAGQCRGCCQLSGRGQMGQGIAGYAKKMPDRVLEGYGGRAGLFLFDLVKSPVIFKICLLGR